MSEPLSIFKADFLHYESTEEPTEMKAKAIWYRNVSSTTTSVIISLYSRGFYVKGTLNHVSDIESKSRQNQFVSAGLLRNVFQLEFQNEFVLVIFHETVELRIEAMLFSFPRNCMASCKTFNQYLKTLISDKFCTEEKLNTFFIELNISPPWVKNPETFKLLESPKLYVDTFIDDPNVFEDNIQEIGNKTVPSYIIKNDNENPEEVIVKRSSITEENKRTTYLNEQKHHNKTYEHNRRNISTSSLSSHTHSMVTTEKSKGDYKNLYRKHRIIDSSTLPNKPSLTKESLDLSKKYLSLRNNSTLGQPMSFAGSTPDLWGNSEKINQNYYDDYEKTTHYSKHVSNSLNRSKLSAENSHYNKKYLDVNNEKTLNKNIGFSGSIPDLSRNTDRTNRNQRRIYDPNMTTTDYHTDSSDVSKDSTKIIETMDNRKNYLHVKTITVIDQIMSSSSPDLSDNSEKIHRNQRNIHETNIKGTDHSVNFTNSTEKILQSQKPREDDIKNVHINNLMTIDQSLATEISTSDVSERSDKAVKAKRGTCDTNIVITDYSTNYPSPPNRLRIQSEKIGNDKSKLPNRFRLNSEIIGKDKNHLHLTSIMSPTHSMSFASSTPDLTDNSERVNRNQRNIYEEYIIKTECPLHSSHSLRRSLITGEQVSNNEQYLPVNNYLTTDKSKGFASSTPDLTENSKSINRYHKMLHPKNIAVPDYSIKSTSSLNISLKDKEHVRNNKSYLYVNNLMRPGQPRVSARSTPDLSESSGDTIINRRHPIDQNILIEDHSKGLSNSFNTSSVYHKQENGSKNLLYVNDPMKTGRPISSSSSIPDLTNNPERSYRSHRNTYKRSSTLKDYPTDLSSSMSKCRISREYMGNNQHYANEKNNMTRDRPRSTSSYLENSTTENRNSMNFHERNFMDDDQILDSSNFINIPRTIRKEWDNIQTDLHKKHVIETDRSRSTLHYPKKSKKKRRSTEYYYETNVVDIDPEMGSSHFKDIPIKIVTDDNHSVTSNTISENSNNPVNYLPSWKNHLKKTSKRSEEMDENQSHSIEKTTIVLDHSTNYHSSDHQNLDVTGKANKIEERPAKLSTSIKISREKKGKSEIPEKKFTTFPSFGSNDDVFVETTRKIYDQKHPVYSTWNPVKDNQYAKEIIEFPPESSIYPSYLQESIDEMFEESEVEIDNLSNLVSWTECSPTDHNQKSSTLVEMVSQTNETHDNWSLRDNLQRRKSLFDAVHLTKLEWDEKVDRLHYDPIRKNYQIDDNGSLLLYCCRQVPVNEEVVT